ncbi:MAG TPA: DegT/DnrJ/EryC1/StrS family aminotransferase [Kiritimatiellia bacterium]|nr:DegT/DnrJ/EryC1/StrS family aminotransferase [Kiritimatiellia bacterium]HRZ11507.1 DegT/DnrJ/EryC1/StrS family aminotransferase [Kiritimatiellia bacterium]HSA16942.1 DegT/DnrJ/EryC1/StrS family aminotransferase [Kiritimatiellia bacterium]
MIIPTAKPCLDASDRAALLRVFDSGLVADGEEIAAFEAELAARLGLPGAVAVGSGFAALHLALLGLGVGAGDEVVVPCVSTCPAMRNAVWAAGATPVYADVNRADFNLSAESARGVLTPRAKAIIAPHHTGVIADIPALAALGAPVIEDCAQALGGTWQGRPAGSFGAASVFSFYATKIITTVDGGAVASPSAPVLERVRGLRYYRHCGDDRMRFNYKMQNLGAALGRSQLTKLPGFVQRRAALGRRYLAAFCEAGGRESQSLHRNDGSVYFKLALRLPPATRDRLLGAAERLGLPCSTEFWWIAPSAGERYPNAARLMKRIVALPVYPAATDEEAARVETAFRQALKEAGPLRDGEEA